jgi:hypothetical protein
MLFGEVAQRLAAAGRVAGVGVEQLHQRLGVAGVVIVGAEDMQRCRSGLGQGDSRELE